MTTTLHNLTGTWEAPNRQTANIAVTMTVDGMEQAALALDARALAKLRNVMHALGVTHLRVDGLCVAAEPETAAAFQSAVKRT